MHSSLKTKGNKLTEDRISSKSNFNSINIKIGLSFLIIFTILLTATVTTTYFLFRGIIKSSEDRLSQNLTNTLSISISRISFSGKYHAQIFTDQLLNREEAIKYIVILDNQSEVVSNSSKDEFTEFINRKHMSVLASRTGNEMNYVTCCGDQQIKEIAMPYFGSFDEGQIGVIIVGISTLETLQEIQNSRLILTILAILVTIIGVILIYLTTRWLSAPIRLLASTFQGILDNAPLLIHIRDTRGNIIASSEEPLPTAELFSEKPELHSQKLVKEIKYKDSLRTFLIINFSLSDSKGRIYGICDIATDITEHEKTQKALIKSETDFKAIFDLTPVGITNIGPEGKFIRANPALEKMLGYSEEELKSKTIYELTHPEDIPTTQNNLNDIITNSQDIEFDKRYIRKDNEIVWGHVIAVVQKDERGNFLQTISMIENVTEKKKIQFARDALLVQEQQARIEAQNALKIREEFLSIASHELKTPLTSLLLQTEFLYRLFKDDRLLTYEKEKLEKLFQGSIQQLDRFSKLVNDLLNVSRIQSGKLVPSKEDVNLYQVVENVVQRFKMEIEKTHTIVEVNGDQQTIGHWSELHIEQIVVNLLSNALKFAAGSKILINVSKDKEWATLSVQDFGIGIPHKDLDRIFERFERAVPIEHYGGLGLGLFIVKQFTESHGGKVSVQSEKGKGATFRVVLPLQ